MPEISEKEHWIESPGGRLFAKSWTPREPGSPMPLILFHDSLGCVALWRQFPRLLAKALNRQVIAYDRLGFGHSDRRTDILSKDFVAVEAEQYVPLVCESLSINEFIVCGHSVGGGMAVWAGASLPRQCKAVITIAAQAFVEDRTLAGIKVAEKEFETPESMSRLTRYHGDKAEWVLHAWIDTWLAPAFADWSLDAGLLALRCPQLTIHGEHDEFGSLEHPRRIAGTHGECRVLPGIGHNPHRECPELLVEVIERWLSSPGSASA
ncbi:alpha/beta fold hydrolase [Rhizobium lusitanum]|uniref:Pimeloyl-ACP methyl ester carboxylesterase n=1 Tax=Rhizobium lusitanum TaxID=293958 RepID=A0A7X0IYH4_9HYPH|nr:alpha/beta hydrolase [Rhizobium lusitanum]MBB6488937.1 pimeloyl-ACP methyl ester carboxylesterase [Rhizobium lusitanum]